MKPLYLEPDEEITSVIDKINASGHQNIALVVAKNSTILQSLINLKLLAKEARNNNTEIAIITNNKIGQRLARQVGLQSYPSLGAISTSPEPAPKAEKPSVHEEAEEEMQGGVPVHQYQPDKTPAKKEEPKTEPETEPVKSEPIMPIEPAPVPAVDAMIEEEKKPTAISIDEGEADEDEAFEEKLSEPKEEPSHFAPKKSENLPPIVQRTMKIPGPPREPFKIPWKAIIIALVGLVVVGVLSFIFLPKATVTLALPATKIDKTETLTAAVNSNDSTGSGVIAGNLLEVEKSGTQAITATGKKDIGTKSAGNITIYNKVGGSNVTLAAGTVLATGGKNFTLDKTVVVPIATVSGSGTVVPGQVPASITASSAGDTYNVSSATFSVTGQSSNIYGTGSTTGGSTKQVTVLSQEDIDKALTTIRDSLTAEAKTELQSKAEGQTLLDAAIWKSSNEEKVDKAVNSQVDSATATVIYKFSAIVFDNAQVVEKMTTALKDGLTEEQDLVIPDDKKPSAVFAAFNADKTAMTLTATGTGFAVNKIDKSAIAKALKNRSVSSAESYLKDNVQAESVDIKLSPSWWPSRLPMLAGRIDIEYGFDSQQTATPSPSATTTPSPSSSPSN